MALEITDEDIKFMYELALARDIGLKAFPSQMRNGELRVFMYLALRGLDGILKTQNDAAEILTDKILKRLEKRQRIKSCMITY